MIQYSDGTFGKTVNLDGTSTGVTMVNVTASPIDQPNSNNVGSVSNLVNISIDSNPQPRTQVQSEGQAEQDVSNGFVQNSATNSVSFSDGTLNKTDFVSTQMGSLASGGIRPGEVQFDPNPRPGNYISQFYVDPALTQNPNAPQLNASVLNGLSAMTTFNTYVDPLLLDLTGNGVHMTGIENGVMFDTDHSGTLKRTGWADTQTGMLVVDDGTGNITNASQFLSEYYAGKAGTNGGPGQTPFKDGFAALASADANHDGVIDKNDPIWAKLKVWVDANHDAKSGAGELKTLEALGITQINVASAPVGIGETLDGNEVLGRGSFVINGQTRQVLSVDFLASPVSNTFADVTGGTKLTSVGNGATKTAFTSTSAANETLDASKLGVDNVYAGTGNDTLIAASTGSWLVGGGGSNIYQGGAGDDVFVISGKDNPANIHGNGGRDTAIIVGDQGVGLNMAQTGLTIAEGGHGDDVIVSGGNSSVFIRGGTGNDILMGGGGNDVIVGGSGHNTIIGGTSKAVIFAGPNGDTIYASAGGSVIHAGGGDDHIYGGKSDDVIEAGKGNAVIDGGGGTNIVTLHGKHGDYTITKTATGYTVADQVAGRDGSLTLTNIQKLNFSDISAVDLTLPNAMPVADTLRTDSTGAAFNRTQPHLISAAQLLANDQRLGSQGNLHITTVGDAVGGTVSLTSAGDVLFTPNARFTGVMSFKYSVADAAGNPAATVVDLSSGQTAPMRATATLLTPEIPTDPLTSQEWYLTDTNVLPVWNDYTGKGIRIGQFEPGGQFATAPEILDIHHPDLAANIDSVWLQTQQANRTLPTNVSNHATMVAGVMVAAKNGQGGVGVAYDATIGGYYLANSGADLSGVGHMVSYDIANNSWGFANDFALSNLQRGQINTESALVSNAQYAADNGRGGLGTIIVTAGGNQREKGGSAQGSLTNNNRFSIEVGAINAQGDLSTLQIGSAPFSNPGASLLVSAPGSNVVSTSEMLETDQGSTFGSDYSAMQGTSFATPIVSGIVALMLQANPNLGYRDVQKILALSARNVNDTATKWDTNGAHNWNGGGMHTSHDYGFGEVDARAAVRLAESWQTQATGANEAMYSASSGALGQAIAPGSTFSSSLSMQAGLTVEHAEIDFDANVGRLGDLVVTLIAPNGTRSILLNREGKIPDGVKGASDTDVGSTQSGKFGYTFMSTHDWGEQSAGSWKLEVTDAATGQPVTLNNWALRLYGSPTTPDDTYYYTDEFAAQVAASSARGTLDDAVNGMDGGRNTINAAAVSGDTSVDLSTGVASIGGTRLTVARPDTIQNIVTGDGNDTLKANNTDALLDGGRGNNTLIGGSGKDYFVVHRRTGGSDTIVNFAASRGEIIDLVGFKGKSFADLKMTQDGANVRIDLGDGQTIVLQNQSISSLTAAQFQFQDTFVAPSAYVSSQTSAGNPNPGAGTVVLNGGAQGVSYTTDSSGQMVASLAGVVYSHDTASSDTFFIQNQPGATSFHNALRGFRHGIDKIDLSQTGITSFSDLVIESRNRATINGIVQIHGVSVSSKSLSTSTTPVELVYLDALDLAQVTSSDFIFSTPGLAGVVTTPPVTTPVTPPPVVSPGQIYASQLTARQIATMSADQIQALGTNIQFLSADAWKQLIAQGVNVLKRYGAPSGAAITSIAVLSGGASLSSGQSLVAGGARLLMQGDGNLVAYDATGKAVWNSGTYDPANVGSTLSMQADGNLVIYRPNGQAIWSSGTYGQSGEYLVLASDGTLSLQTGGQIGWLTAAQVQSLTATQAAGIAAAQMASMSGDQIRALGANIQSIAPDAWKLFISQGTNVIKRFGADPGAVITSVAVLGVGASLGSGQSLVAGGMTLAMQGDGNLVIYDTTGKAVWNSGTGDPTNQGASLFMQGDGNLVIYRPNGQAIWSSGTGGNAGAYLVMGSDGSLNMETGSRTSWLTSTQVQNLTSAQAAVMAPNQVNALGSNVQYLSSDAWNMLASLGANVVKSFGGAAGAALTSAVTLHATNGQNFVLDSGKSIVAGGMKLAMQPDGNLVIYNPAGQAIWSSGTSGAANQGSRLIVQTDGNVVIYRPNGTPIWNAGTSDNAGEYVVFGSDGRLSLQTGSRANWLTADQTKSLTSIQAQQLNSNANSITVAGPGDAVAVSDANNTIKLTGSAATVVGGNGANIVTSSDGSATISLGNGNNTVSGVFQSLTVGNGTNTVTSTGSLATLNLGDGQDVATVSGSISTINVGHGNYNLDFSGLAGQLKFGSDVAADHLWFQHVGQDLDISVIGSAETVVLKNWYASSPHQADITSGDGKTVSSFNVEKLVQAMAAFAPPAAGATSLTPTQQTTLQPVLAANWH